MHGANLLRSSLQRAIRYYQFLPTFPSHKALVFYLATLSIAFGLLFSFLTSSTLLLGLKLGVSFLIIQIIVDLASSYLLTRGDAIFDMRRTSALSLTCFLMWPLLLGVNVVFKVPNYGVYFFIPTAFAFTSSLRYLVLKALSSMDATRLILSSFSQPLALLLTFHQFSPIGPKYALLTLVNAVIMILVIHTFINKVNEHSIPQTGKGVVTLFRAFLLNWIADDASHLKRELDSSYKRGLATLRTLSIVDNTGKGIVNVILPSVHYGPVKNVGSSALPSLIQRRVETYTKIPTVVLHGTLSHERDLISNECDKIVDEAVDMLTLNDANNATKWATRCVKKEIEGATVMVQIFGEIALVTLTCSPKEMEDLPRELELFVERTAKKLGVQGVIVVDAHNCASGPPLTPADIENLKKSALEALKEAIMERKSPFKAAFSRVPPSDTVTSNCLGPGGIASIVVNVNDDANAYVIADGNNLAAGLRERIIVALQELGIRTTEVFTTDTHIAVGVPRIKKGYRAVGEGITTDKLLNYVRKCTTDALANLKEASTWWDQRRVRVRYMNQENVVGYLELIPDAITTIKRLLFKLIIPAVALVLTLTCIT